MRKISNGMNKFLILFLVATFVALLCPPVVSATSILGSAQSFAVLGASTVTNDHVGENPTTQIYGDLGVTPGTSVTGFPPGIVSGGTIHIDDEVAITAMADATIAYNALAGLPFDYNYTGFVLGSTGYATLTPGVYHFDTSAQLTGTLTLDGQGDANAAWVFQIASTLITSPDSAVNVINTGSGAGVYWQVGSSATLDLNTTFAGNILALASISLNPTAEILCGRAFALTGEVTLIDNLISNDNTAQDFGSGRDDFGSGGFSGGLEFDDEGNVVPVEGGNGGAPVPEPATMLLLGSGLAGLAAFRKRFKKA